MSNRDKEHFFAFARTAAARSYANRDKVGAAAFKGDRIIATGRNGTCAGHPNVCEDFDTTETLPEVAHAEINLIGQLAQSTETTQGVRVYITRKPCMQCAVALLAAGIHEIHCLNKGSGEGISHLQKHALVAIYQEDSLDQVMEDANSGIKIIRER